jgi:hypothetical protein
MTQGIDPEALRQVCERASLDASYRKKLIQNPHLGIKEVTGVWASTMLRIKCVEQDPIDRDPEVDVLIVLPVLKRGARRDPDPVPMRIAAAAPAVREPAVTYDAVCRAPIFDDREALLRACPAWCPPEGLVLEFGVFQGASLACLRTAFGPPVIGYDSFDGLPEDWTRAPGRVLPKGHFRCRPPVIDGAELVIGEFGRTVGRDLGARARPIRFAHIDVDLHASCVTVLDAIRPWLQAGSVLLFDELAAFETSAYQNWKDGEWRALQESGIQCQSVGRTYHTQCALRVSAWAQGDRGGLLS